MNLLREVRRRRSSSANNAEMSGTEKVTASFSNAIANGHASLRRSLLPRSRTASEVNKAPEVTIPNSATSRNISKVTDWSYCRPPSEPPKMTEDGIVGKQKPPKPKVPARSASLGRRKACGTAKRSVTMPNFQEEQERQFSTFKKQPNEAEGCLNRSNNKIRKQRPLSADVSEAFQRAEQMRNFKSTEIFSSVDSLLDGEGNFILTETNVDKTDSLDMLNEADECDNRNEGLTRTKANVSSLDSLLDNGEIESSNSSSISQRTFGSIQLKVQEIRNQIDTIKVNNSGKLKPDSVQKSALQLFGLVNQGQMEDVVKSSSSPSTLSPCSSNNSVPSSSSSSRPQSLRLSHNVESGNNNDRFVFFFDIMSTQERIAKVNFLIILCHHTVTCSVQAPLTFFETKLFFSFCSHVSLMDKTFFYSSTIF